MGLVQAGSRIGEWLADPTRTRLIRRILALMIVAVAVWFALTAALAMEHTQHGIRINATAPGGTEAPPRKIPRNAAKQSRQLVPAGRIVGATRDHDVIDQPGL